MNSSSNRKVKTMKMKKIILAGLMSFAGFLFADDAVDDSYWSDGEWVDMASEATGVDSQKVIEGILKGLEKVELTKGYKSPIGQAERAKIIKSVSARHGKIWIPRKLSRSEKEMMESIRNNTTFTPDLSRDDKAIFDKEKNIF